MKTRKIPVILASMNLFLLVAVPLSAFVFYHVFLKKPETLQFSNLLPPIVANLGILVLSSPFYGWKIFDGNALTALLGLIAYEGLLTPGLTILAFYLYQKRQSAIAPLTDGRFLGVWLAFLFTFVGVQEFALVNRQSDAFDLFLGPLWRILAILWLPQIYQRYWAATETKPRLQAAVVALTFLLSGPISHLLVYVGWGWVPALGLAGTFGTAIFLFVRNQTTSATPPKPL